VGPALWRDEVSKITHGSEPIIEAFTRMGLAEYLH
jgi:hypothetical protein